MHSLTWKFHLGIVLLTTNSFIGWAGILAGIYLAKRSGKKYFITLGFLIYLLSWGLLALGVVLAGPDGLRISKHIFFKYGWGGVLIILYMIWTCINILKMNEPKKNSRGEI
jgi:hypothetical protein